MFLSLVQGVTWYEDELQEAQPRHSVSEKGVQLAKRVRLAGHTLHSDRTESLVDEHGVDTK